MILIATDRIQKFQCKDLVEIIPDQPITVITIIVLRNTGATPQTTSSALYICLRHNPS